MFNSPPGLSDAMDLAKMLAILKLIEPLEDGTFKTYRQTRTGLLSYPLDPAAARAHLAVSIHVQMALHPHIVHIVGHTEAHHAATAEDVIEASGLARTAIEHALKGSPEMTADPQVMQRAEELAQETRITLDAIRSLASPGVEDPIVRPCHSDRCRQMRAAGCPAVDQQSLRSGSDPYTDHRWQMPGGGPPGKTRSRKRTSP